MKKIICIASVLLALSACHRDEDGTFSIAPNTLHFEAGGGTQSVKIHSNLHWEITTDNQTWYTVTPSSGSGDADIKIEVASYDEAQGRSAQITFKAGGFLETLALVQARPAVPANPEALTCKVYSYEQDITIDVPAEFAYKAVLPEDAGYLTVVSSEKGKLTLHLAANTTAENRMAEISIQTSAGEVIETVSLTQSWRNIEPHELLFEEIFFTGNLLPGGTGSDSSEGDQYFKLTNNTDHTIYADGLLIAFSETDSQKTSVGAFWAYPEQKDSIGVSSIYRIPGSGKEVEVKAGESLLLALAAQNFSKDNPNGFDLSVADFEFYDENDLYPDTNNPDVRDLLCWFKSSWSITGLHDRGFESYAIAVAPATVTVDSFIADYKWVGKRVFDWNGHHVEQDIKGAYLIPNTWVIDGVNCALEETLNVLAFNPSIDAGYAHVGKTDKDPERYGKSVRRMKGADGKFPDTDNSTNDFAPDATPTLTK